VLREVMPRTGSEYHVDDVWRDRVRERLRELGKKPAWLAAESGCPKSMISELLSGKRSNTTYLPEIHEALNLPMPHGPLMSADDEEILTLARLLTPEQRAKLVGRAEAYREENKKKQ